MSSLGESKQIHRRQTRYFAYYRCKLITKARRCAMGKLADEQMDNLQGIVNDNIQADGDEDDEESEA